MVLRYKTKPNLSGHSHQKFEAIGLIRLDAGARYNFNEDRDARRTFCIAHKSRDNRRYRGGSSLYTANFTRRKRPPMPRRRADGDGSCRSRGLLCSIHISKLPEIV